jgi:hypothetical protein
VPVSGDPCCRAAMMSWHSGTLAASAGQIKQTYRLAVGALELSYEEPIV